MPSSARPPHSCCHPETILARSLAKYPYTEADSRTETSLLACESATTRLRGRLVARRAPRRRRPRARRPRGAGPTAPADRFIKLPYARLFAGRARAILSAGRADRPGPAAPSPRGRRPGGRARGGRRNIRGFPGCANVHSTHVYSVYSANVYSVASRDAHMLMFLRRGARRRERGEGVRKGTGRRKGGDRGRRGGRMGDERFDCVAGQRSGARNTHTHTRARAHTHTHARTQARTHARTHARTFAQTSGPTAWVEGQEGGRRRAACVCETLAPPPWREGREGGR